MAWAPAYATATELKAFVRIDDTVDDAEIGLALEGASRVIDKATDRQFGVLAAAEARVYVPEWNSNRCAYVARIDDLMTTTDLVVTVSSAVVAADSRALLPLNAAENGRPWTKLVTDSATPGTIATGYQATVDVTAIWGWTAVPDTIKEMTLLQASRFLARREAPFGVAGSPDAGSEMRLLAKADPDVALMATAYRRDWPRL